MLSFNVKQKVISIVNWTISISVIILLVELPAKYTLLLLTILVLFFVYRIYINKNDLMFQAREQLETVMFGKPFRLYKKKEQIKMKKFGGWK